ncbi:MAG: RHS repeat domain-containing protein [Lachnospiraceae bacterium]
MKRCRGILSALAAGVVAITLLLPSLPAKAAVGDAAYIAAVNRAIQQSLTVNVISLEESLSATVTGIPFTTRALQGENPSQYEMDASGNITCVLDGVRKITCTYDEKGSVTGLIFYEPSFDASGTMIPGSYTEQTEVVSTPVYGSDGRLSEITGDSFGILDFTYDSEGRITSVKKGWSKDHMTTEYRYSYDAAGRLCDVQLLAAGSLISDDQTILFTDSGLPLAQVITSQDTDEDGNKLPEVVHQAVYRYGDNGALVEQALQYTECDYTMMTEYGY